MINESYIEKFKNDLENKNGLQMLNSYIKPKNSFPKNYSCTSIDIGGTNFRIAEVNFDSNGNPTVINEKKCTLPGSKFDKEITVNVFFNFLANEIKKYDNENVGLCFSYPCEILDNKDGKIITFSKEVHINGAEGKILGEEINKELVRIGSFERKFSVINDTVSCLLGLNDANLGMILGTGFNISFIEKDGYVINTEAGRYERFPSESFDFGPLFEMKVSGAYLLDLLNQNPDKKEYIIDRAGKMIAIELAGIYKHLNKPLKIAVEGSVYFNREDIRNSINKYLNEYQVEYVFLDGRNKILIGTAIATI